MHYADDLDDEQPTVSEGTALLDPPTLASEGSAPSRRAFPVFVPVWARHRSDSVPDDDRYGDAADWLTRSSDEEPETTREPSGRPPEPETHSPPPRPTSERPPALEARGAMGAASLVAPLLEESLVFAASNEPVFAPDRRKKKRFRAAHRAMALAVAGLLFGVLVAPLALAFGQRTRLAELGEPTEDAVMASNAVRVGKLGFAIHLAIALTVIPWVLFMLPLLHG